MADFTVNSMFGDHMVLQREKPVTVWGTGEPGASVTLSLGKQEKTALVSENGQWNITLDPISSGGPYQMRVESGNKKIAFQDILAGEVWICSGQSNMQWTTSAVADAEIEMRKAADYPDIRLSLVPKWGADRPKTSLDANWKICSPDAIKDFSAVAYFFARELKNSPSLKNVPMGLIDTSYGGTTVEAWMSTETLCAKFPHEELRPSLFGWKPSSMYNGMIAPLVPFQIRGFLWYQGESNCGKPEQYTRLFPGMIQNWREAWKQPDLPFLFVQLPNYAEEFDGLHFTWLREAQHQVARKEQGVYMAVTIDTGDPYDVHPKHKRDVGLRLSLLALSKVYGEDVPCNSPVYRSHEIKGAEVHVAFDHVEKGLVNKNCGPLRGFAIAGEDGAFWYSDASIEGDCVVLTNPSVPKPRYIRYAWEGNPHADLYNSEGLPAAPFRTDRLPIEDLELYQVPQSRTMKTSLYECHIDGYSWLLNLKVKGKEFLEPMHSTGLPGGSFLSFWGPARLVHISQQGPRRLFAWSEAVSILFEFNEDNMVWTIDNRTDGDLTYTLLLSKEIRAAGMGNEKIKPVPIQGEVKDITWYLGDAALQMTGGAKCRFPFNEKIPNQALDIQFKPREKKQVRFRFRPIAQSEREQIKNLMK